MEVAFQVPKLSDLSPNSICRGTVAFVWFYHGLVPKLLGPHHDEMAMNLALGLAHEAAAALSMVAGVVEILMAVAIVVFWRKQWPMILTIISMLVLLAFSLVLVPELAIGAFNPVTINVSVIALALVALASRNAKTEI